MSELKITILGCGNSTGVPAIGGYWGDCDPDEPKNKRTRSSILVQQNEKKIVIDTGPDFHAQLTREKTSDIDAVLYTHQHSDHVNGIDELRVIRHRNKKTHVPCYGNAPTFEDLKTRFHYMFEGGNHELYPPIIEAHIFSGSDFGQPQNIAGLEVTPFQQDHGTCVSVGYRFADMAYSVDMWTLDTHAIETLKGIKTWIVDAAAYNQDSNPVHANLETIYKLNEQIGAEQVILTSLSLAMDYQTLLAELPEGYMPAYDGMTLSL